MKKAIYSVFNGESYDEIAFKTLASQVICRNDLTLDELIEKTPIMGLNIGRYDKSGDIGFPYVAQDGVMEIGRIIDFHELGTNKDFDSRLESINGVLKSWQDFSAVSLWAQKYLRINDWYGGSEDGRFYYKQENKGMYTENVKNLFVDGNPVAKGDSFDIYGDGSINVYFLGGGLRIVRQHLRTGASNSAGGVGFNFHFPKAYKWVKPISLVSSNWGDTGSNSSGYCVIDNWNNISLQGGCYNMRAGYPTWVILTYLAEE